MKITPGVSVNQAVWNDERRRRSAANEVRFARSVEEHVFRPLLEFPVEVLSRFLANELTQFVQSPSREAGIGALAAMEDPAASGIYVGYMADFALEYQQRFDGKSIPTFEPKPSLIRDAGNLLRLVGTAYEVAVEEFEKRALETAKNEHHLLQLFEQGLDDGDTYVELRIPIGNADELLKRIVRVGQVQTAYRDGFMTKILEWEGVSSGWWSLDAFDKDTNRCRQLRDAAERNNKFAQLGAPILKLMVLDQNELTLNFEIPDDFVPFSERAHLVSSAGRYRWVVLPSSVLFWGSRLFGLSEGGDISGTTADALFVLEALLALPEAEHVKSAWGSNRQMSYLIPLIHMVREQHHSLLETGYVLSLNRICEYVVGDYTTLLPNEMWRPKVQSEPVRDAFLAQARKHSPKLRWYFDGIDHEQIVRKIMSGYPPPKNPRDPMKSRGDLTCAIGNDAQIWTMETPEDIEAYREISTCSRHQYRMLTKLRDQQSVALDDVFANSLAESRHARQAVIDEKNQSSRRADDYDNDEDYAELTP